MRLLVTGGCGFLGSNLAAHAIEQGHEVYVIDNFFRSGSEKNAEWLKSVGTFSFERADTRDQASMERLVRDFRPDCVFHLAGQVAMTTSLKDPRLDFEINVLGGLNVLEAVRRHAPSAAIFYSSTNKVYGDLEYLSYHEAAQRYETPDYPRGFDETLRLDFRSPYGCSKGAVDQYMLDYARMFGVRSVVFRHSSIFGGRQFPTYDQGWLGWFVMQALQKKHDPEVEPFTISGNGKQVRDVLFARDIVACYFSAYEQIERCAGNAYNIGGGPENSLSLLELFAVLERELGVDLKYHPIEWRQSDQKVFVADIGKAERDFHWRPRVTMKEGVRAMIRWIDEASAQ